MHLFDWKYSKNGNIVKYYYNLKLFWNRIYSCDGKAVNCHMILQLYAGLLLKKHLLKEAYDAISSFAFSLECYKLIVHR